MNVYLDESGDLGWTFDRPYRAGGSSRYLTISALIIPKTASHLSKRVIKKVYKKRGQPTSRELKGKNLSRDERLYFAEKVSVLLNKHPQIIATAITVRKKNVRAHIRQDANKLYNYMVNFLLLEEIRHFPAVTFIPDPRTIKVASGNSLVDYLQTKLWFELNSATVIEHKAIESHAALNLQFADFLAHIVWRHYEDNSSAAFNVLKRQVVIKHLFF